MPAPLNNHNHRIHGLSHTRIDNIYRAMKSRCYNKNNAKYHRYGARGIKMCDSWLNDKSAFFTWAFNNGYNEDLTIDRINNNGDYCPENCRWVNLSEQANNKSTNVIIAFEGDFYTMAEFCRKYGLKYKVFHKKYRVEKMPILSAMIESRACNG